MAWETGTYACGHEGRKQFYGSHKEREYAVKTHFEKVCPDCWKAECAKRNEEAAAKNKDAALPALTGSEKQIAWAESIRAKLVGKPDFVFALQKTSAKWWIDHRDELDDESDAAVFRKTMEYANALLKEGKLQLPAVPFPAEGKSKYELTNIVNKYIEENKTGDLASKTSDDGMPF